MASTRAHTARYATLLVVIHTLLEYLQPVEARLGMRLSFASAEEKTMHQRPRSANGPHIAFILLMICLDVNKRLARVEAFVGTHSAGSILQPENGPAVPTYQQGLVLSLDSDPQQGVRYCSPASIVELTDITSSIGPRKLLF